MRLRKFAISGLFLLFVSLGAHAQNKTVAERLGHPADSKLLIIHADDLAVAHSVDSARQQNNSHQVERPAETSESALKPTGARAAEGAPSLSLRTGERQGGGFDLYCVPVTPPRTPTPR